MSATSPWDTREYQRITSATYNDGRLAVRFEDGSEATVEAVRVLPPRTAPVRWETLSHDAYEIAASTEEGEGVEIPWSTIRVLTDDAYSAHLTRAADEQARQIGLRIKELRESRQLSSKDLAERAGITPQSMSRIENGRHDVVYTTLQRILTAMGYSLRDLAVAPSKSVSISALYRRLEGVGVTQHLIQRLLPEGLPVRDHDAGDDARAAQIIAATVSRVFHWSASRILGDEPLRFDPSLAAVTHFKTYGRANELRATAYTFYAHYLALLLLESTTHLAARPLPSDPSDFRAAVLDAYGSLDFASLLRFTWDHGIPVLPLRDPGAFHGACWRINGRNIIVLKQTTNAQSRWVHDLLHEIKHVMDHLNDLDTTIIEGEEIPPGPSPTSASPKEREASRFATDVLLQGRAEELTKRAVAAAEGSMERLKGAVQHVAEIEQVPVDGLANYVAARLSRQKQDWWGAASNLQVTDPSPWVVARRELLARIEPDSLSEQERAQLIRAVTASGEG